MSFGMSDEHTSYQMRSVRDQVARSRPPRRDMTGRNAVGRDVANRSSGHAYLPRLRSRVGFTLVEAGLCLLTPEGPEQHGYDDGTLRRSARAA